jgi:hypothetical protein
MKKKTFLNLKGFMVFSVVVMMALSFVATASATNGYFAHGYSVKNKALAGAQAQHYLWIPWQHPPTPPEWRL